MVKHRAEWPVREVGKTLIAFARIEQDQKFMAERKWREHRLAPKPQAPCDHGLFSDDRQQLDLLTVSSS